MNLSLSSASDNGTGGEEIETIQKMTNLMNLSLEY